MKTAKELNLQFPLGVYNVDLESIDRYSDCNPIGLMAK